MLKSLPFCPVYAINKGEETKNKHMDIPTSLLIIGFAALIHANFQLSVSVLTMLTSHVVGTKRSHAKLLSLTSSFLAGTEIMTLLLVSFIALVLIDIFGAQPTELVWACASGLMVGLGIATWLFYYRREKGTSLWIPRSFAKHLNDRSKATSSGAEAFSLGLTSVISELLFIVGPLVIAALVLIGLPSVWQLVGLAIYTIVSTFSSFIVWGFVGSGHTLSRIQKWRETNKRFLQFVGGGALLVLGFYIYVSEVFVGVTGTM